MKLIIYIFSLTLICLNIYSKPLSVNNIYKLSLDDIQSLTSLDIFKENYSLDEVDLIIKDLYLSDLIYDVIFTNKSSEYSIKIIESNIIEKIYINNNEWIKDELILENLESKENYLLSKNKIKNDIKLINTIYKTKGYNNSSVIVSIEKYSQDRINIIYEIDEGPRSKISLIKFYGNLTYSGNYLSSLINSRNLSFYNIFKSGSNLNPAIFNFDESIILKHYQDNGFINANVTYSLDKGNFGQNTLKFYINEGQRYKINSIDYDLNDLLSISDLDLEIKKFNKNIQSNENYFSNKILNSHLSLLNKRLQSINIFNSSFNFELIELDEKFDVRFYLGDIKPIIVNKINIQGNSITKQNVIRSKIPFEPGDYLNKFQIEQAKKNLTKFSFINSVDIEIDNKNDDTADIEINIDEEVKTGNILFAGTFNSDTEVGFQFGIEDKNIFGSGNTLNSNFIINSEDVKFDLNYKQYPLYNSRISNTYSIFNQDIDYTSSFGYKVFKQGIGYDLNFAQNESINLGIGISYEKFKGHTPKNSTSTSISDNIGKFDNTNLRFRAVYDTTDNFLNPTKGYLNEIFVKLSPEGLSDDPFMQLILKNKNYMNLRDSNNFIFFINNYGYSESFDNKLKTINAFSLGGNNFKGFDYRGIGPSDSNNIYLGGNEFFTSTIGYGSSFIFDEKDNINIKLFLTTGSLWNSDYETTSNVELRSSAGISFDFITAIGPISFSYTSPITKETSDKTREFAFTIGSSF